MTTEHNQTKIDLNEIRENYSTIYKSQFIDLDDDPTEIQCLLCENKYTLPTDEQDFLTHLFTSHRLVIGDVQKIASLKSYIHFWRTKLRDEPLTNFCTTMLMNCTPDGKQSKDECYFLLSDILPEDKTLRNEIHRAKLEWVLSVQEQERTNTTFKRGCMLCRTEFGGLRSIYLKHLSEKHNIQLGRPENLVFIDKYLDKIENNIEQLICIYCEKNFKSRFVLREHMRKKMHKRVHPNNKYYDRFYVANYLEADRTWNHKEKFTFESVEEGDDNDDIILNDDEDGWSDWNDDSIVITCLFCKYTNKEFNGVLQHMINEHNFNLEEIIKSIDFYEKIKIVNYIRYQISLSKCIFCDMQCDDPVDHMKNENHYKLPDSKTWRQPIFYFPMSEDDSFLYNLDTNCEELYSNEMNNTNQLQHLSISENI